MAAATLGREALEPLLGATLDKTAASTCILAEGMQQADERAAKKVQWKLTVALLLCFTFMIIEFVGGILANSLAIMTDAAHLLSDVSGFGVSLWAGWYAARKSRTTHTFGYHRVEVLGALASVLSIWLVTGILVYEAIDRVVNPVRVNGKVMFFLALAGCAVNLVNLFVLDSHVGHSHGPGEGRGCGGHGHSHGGGEPERAHSHSMQGNGHAHSLEPDDDEEAMLPVSQPAGSVGHDDHDRAGPGHSHSHSDSHGRHGHSGSHGREEGHGGENINMRGAVLHIIGDLVQSVGVAAAGALIWWKQDDPRFQLADPICTFLFALLVLWTTRLILQDISDILMERVPRNLDVASIESKLMQVPGVQSVFDLHVWALKPSIPLLAAHVTVQSDVDPGRVLADVTTSCRDMGIMHTTIQICDEGHGHGCQTRLPPSLAD